MNSLTTANLEGSPFLDRTPGCARILLVEDNPGDAELVRAVLEQNDVRTLQVEHSDHVTDAVARLDAEAFDLVLLDLGMPESQGLETLCRVQVAAKTIPIIVLTGQDDLELSTNAIRQGAQDFLCKNHVAGELLVRTIRNAVERHRILAAATAGSVTDELTGLYNRRGLLTVSASLFKAARRLGTPIVLLYADLDGLKSINDTLGHEAGDRALREAAQVLRETFRDADVLSRLGGDEFAVLALGTTGINGELLRERVELAVSRRNAQPGRSFLLSISLGAVELDATQPVSLETLLQEADQKMYAQKRSKQRCNVVV